MEATHRTDIVAGLRSLADFLTANPGVPVPDFRIEVLVHVYGPDEEKFDEVDRVADLLGVTVQDRTDRGGHYTATRAFGPVEYRCLAIPEAVMAAHYARQSYVDSIITDEQVA